MKDEKIKVIVFGSIVRNEATLSSDIDVAIISEKVPEKDLERNKILAEIRKSIKGPFEIHLLKPKTWKNWYLRFVKKDWTEVK